jgi:hypothetical protein
MDLWSSEYTIPSSVWASLRLRCVSRGIHRWLIVSIQSEDGALFQEGRPRLEKEIGWEDCQGNTREAQGLPRTYAALRVEVTWYMLSRLLL